jgi:ATP-dependent phosphoenolpyruvate carboxykinase
MNSLNHSIPLLFTPPTAVLPLFTHIHSTSPSPPLHPHLHAHTGAKTGRCPRDKRVVREPSTERDIWWASSSSGSPNYEMDERSFLLNRETAVSYLNSLHHVFIFDGYANWEPSARIKVRNSCTKPAAA